MVTRAESQGLIPDEELGSRKYKKSVDVTLCRKMSWDKIHQIRGPGGIASTNAEK